VRRGSASLAFTGDVVAVAKRDLAPGEMLDGEGGYGVWGKLVPAATSRAGGLLPIGLAHKVQLRRPVRAGEAIAMADLAPDALPADILELRSAPAEAAAELRRVDRAVRLRGRIGTNARVQGRYPALAHL
jgi:predicted homoserine dehydrogenase-like protein